MLKNKMITLTTVSNLEDEICKFIQKNITKEVVMNICNCKIVNGQL